MNDICLLLEGTYPYVAGGVSTWVYELIKRLHDVSFSIVYLGSHRSAIKRLHYDIPDNVTEFREFYIFDYKATRYGRSKARAQDYKILEDFLIGMKNMDTSVFTELVRVLSDRRTRTIDMYDLVFSFDAWKVLERIYTAEAKDVSFIDYFWTWRFVYLPFFSLLRVNLPKAKVYHSVSTGYAGVLGALAKLYYKRPFILTEHGIYTRERRIEIAQADWIYSETAWDLKVTEESRDFFKEWWVNLFAFFSKLAYDRADEIISLFEGNRRVQINEGADPSRTRVIPNGIELSEFVINGQDSGRDKKYRVGFMGRVVPIKDVKTFIRACGIISKNIEAVEFLIMGPIEEDEEYYRDCVLLSETEGLSDLLRFTDKVDVHEYYPKLDVLVLTSISEGQPIVVLEAGAYGIPVVATDVGSCSELLHGSSHDDRLLGPSGIITPICDPEATADAVISILKDDRLRRQLSKAARTRVSSYYQMENLIAEYQTLYNRYSKEIRWQV